MKHKRFVVLVLTAAFLAQGLAPAFAEGPQFNFSLGLQYAVNDGSVYPPLLGETDYPDALRPLRAVIGATGGIDLDGPWKLGLAAEVISLSGHGSRPDGSRVYLSALAMPLLLSFTFGESPYLGVNAGYRFGFDQGSAFTVGSTSGLQQGFRLGLAGFYASLDIVFPLVTNGSPGYHWGVGYEGFLQLAEFLAQRGRELRSSS